MNHLIKFNIINKNFNISKNYDKDWCDNYLTLMGQTSVSNMVKNYSGAKNVFFQEEMSLATIMYKFNKRLKYSYWIEFTDVINSNTMATPALTQNLKFNTVINRSIVKRSKNKEKLKFLISFKHMINAVACYSDELNENEMLGLDKLSFNFKKLSFVFFNNLYVITKIIKEYDVCADILINFASTNNKYFSKKIRSLKKNRLKKINIVSRKIKKELNERMYLD